MTLDEALRDIQGYAGAHRIVLPPHARGRGGQRRAHYNDIRHALMHSTHCEPEPNERWRVYGQDLDGDGLRIVLVIEDGLVIVTVMGD